jgi:hypothetical protein
VYPVTVREGREGVLRDENIPAGDYSLNTHRRPLLASLMFQKYLMTVHQDRSGIDMPPRHRSSRSKGQSAAQSVKEWESFRIGLFTGLPAP